MLEIPPLTAMYCTTRVHRSGVVRLRRYSRLSMRAAASKLRANDSSRLCELTSSSKLTDTNLTELCLEIHTSPSRSQFRISYTLVWALFLQWPILSAPKIFEFPTESCSTAYGHDIHAILHDTFHWWFICYQGKLSVNFVYQSAAIWSRYVMLHARHASVSEASPRTLNLQQCLWQPRSDATRSMATRVRVTQSHQAHYRPGVPDRSNMYRGKTSANDRDARRRISSSYEVSRNYRQRTAPLDTLIKTETKIFLDNISIHIELRRKLQQKRCVLTSGRLSVPVPTIPLLVCQTVGV